MTARDPLSDRNDEALARTLQTMVTVQGATAALTVALIDKSGGLLSIRAMALPLLLLVLGTAAAAAGTGLQYAWTVRHGGSATRPEEYTPWITTLLIRGAQALLAVSLAAFTAYVVALASLIWRLA